MNYSLVFSLLAFASTQVDAQVHSTSVNKEAYALSAQLPPAANTPSSDPVKLADNGVYLSVTDFTNGTLVETFADNTPGDHIWANTPGSYICVQSPRVTEKFPESKTWGFRKSGKDYCVVNGLTYEIINGNDMLVYRIVDPELNSYRYASLYFFSRKADSDLYPLSKHNLEMVYSDSPEFVNSLKTSPYFQLKGDEEPIAVGAALYFFHRS
ncbi:hypothetical protein [Spirosoma linguale]|uniref:Uncharacterized protein n=1 Tax=Spirosoma linguale (strain ATCC 33905 / DSM 74 / LMG 10896 / Claus 1) TaxID=504472 RepID=D2QI78_SPILD|nr:hypothetical protein Slin_0914 [Spirosoma linguale DSM 74]